MKNNFPTGFLIVLLLMIGLLLYISHKSPANKAISKNPPEMEVLPLEALTNKWDLALEKLILCESGGQEMALNKNDGAPGSHSYGILQFKIETALWMNKKYKVLPDIEDREIMNVIYDSYFQRELAKRALQDGQWWHWKICGEKLNLARL